MRIRNFIKSFYKPNYRQCYPVGLFSVGSGANLLRYDDADIAAGSVLIAFGGLLVSAAIRRDRNNKRTQLENSYQNGFY